MKKAILYSMLAAFIFLSQITEIAAQTFPEKFKAKGKLSPNSENEDNETDPVFKVMTAFFDLQNKATKSGAEQHVSEMENGLQIVKDIVGKIIEKEYSFKLLSQHKYTINSCLGFKVSAGEFMVKFNNPVFEVGNLGKITIKMSIDKINFSALKIRMKPCSKFEHIPDPCHFGKKIEIGGEATDIRLTAVIAPVARALSGSAGLCFFALEDNVVFKWHIGGMNLKPMQNDLDYLGKEMLEDGLNSGLLNVFYMKFVEISKEVIPKYFEECENAYSVRQIVNNIPGEITSANINSNDNLGNETEKWQIVPVVMKGVLGKLNMNFPEGVQWSIDIKTTENKFITNRSISGKDKSYNIAPGKYNVELNTITVENVPIEKGKETRLKAGFLNIESEGNWELYDESKMKFQTSNNKPQKIALPVGSYQLKLGGQFFHVKIKDGETEEY